MKQKILSLVAPAVVLGLLTMAIWVLQHQLRVFHYHDIMYSIAAIPGRRLCLAIMLSGLSHLVLTGYDVMALHYLGHSLTFGKIAFASFIGYVFSYNIGLSTLDWCLVGSVCYMLLPPSSTVPYPAFLGIFVLAHVIGLISHVPGGIGLFETVRLLLLSPTLPVSSGVGSLLAYLLRCTWIFPACVFER